MTTWPYSYWPYAPVRTDGMGPGMGPGMMNTGMPGTMMEPDHMQQMMAMMKEHMAMTKAIKETVERVERKLIAMEKMTQK